MEKGKCAATDIYYAHVPVTKDCGVSIYFYLSHRLVIFYCVFLLSRTLRRGSTLPLISTMLMCPSPRIAVYWPIVIFPIVW